MDAAPVLQLVRNHELVHAALIIRFMVALPKPGHQVISVYKGGFTGLFQALGPHGPNVRISPDQGSHVTVEGPHLAYAVWHVIAQRIAMTIFYNQGYGEVWSQHLLDTNRACTRPAASVRGGESLVQVELNNVESHVTGPGYPHQGVQVGSVAVKQASLIVHYSGYLKYALFEESQGVGIGEHHGGYVFIHHLGYPGRVHAAVPS